MGGEFYLQFCGELTDDEIAKYRKCLEALVYDGGAKLMESTFLGEIPGLKVYIATPEDYQKTNVFLRLTCGSAMVELPWDPRKSFSDVFHNVRHACVEFQFKCVEIADLLVRNTNIFEQNIDDSRWNACWDPRDHGFSLPGVTFKSVLSDLNDPDAWGEEADDHDDEEADDEEDRDPDAWGEETDDRETDDRETDENEARAEQTEAWDEYYDRGSWGEDADDREADVSEADAVRSDVATVGPLPDDSGAT